MGDSETWFLGMTEYSLSVVRTVISFLIFILLLFMVIHFMSSDNMTSSPVNFSQWWLGNQRAGEAFDDSIENTRSAQSGGVHLEKLADAPADEEHQERGLEIEMAGTVYPVEVLDKFN